MVRRTFDLPSLNGLVVFEAAARHLSLKRAAEELGVTPGAVSKQIRALEVDLCADLFTRVGNGVVLTDVGEELYVAFAQSLARTAEVIGSIRRGDRVRNVTVACTDAFAAFWLIPRMGSFWEQFPDVAVDHLISDNPRDFKRSEVELRIRYGHGSWSDERAELLFEDTIYPVCGPRFAAQHAAVSIDDLPALPLLHVDWVDPEWSDWREVFRRAGVAHGPLGGRRFGKFSVALQAAQAGQGIAVGWHRLVEPLVADGRLCRLTALQLPAPGGYYLTWSDNRPLSAAAERVRDWLRAMAAQERGDAGAVPHR